MEVRPHQAEGGGQRAPRHRGSRWGQELHLQGPPVVHKSRVRTGGDRGGYFPSNISCSLYFWGKSFDFGQKHKKMGEISLPGDVVVVVEVEPGNVLPEPHEAGVDVDGGLPRAATRGVALGPELGAAST